MFRVSKSLPFQGDTNSWDCQEAYSSKRDKMVYSILGTDLWFQDLMICVGIADLLARSCSLALSLALCLPSVLSPPNEEKI